jgi:DMSO/TMAO reductase YedYZ molybdopterin-dependent catalytic subunit
VSIDIDKAFGRRTDTLIVYEMNGEQLPRDHGCAKTKTK